MPEKDYLSSYKRNEKQKPTTQAYLDGWDTIFKKTPQLTPGNKTGT